MQSAKCLVWPSSRISERVPAENKIRPSSDQNSPTTRSTPPSLSHWTSRLKLDRLPGFDGLHGGDRQSKRLHPVLSRHRRPPASTNRVHKVHDRSVIRNKMLDLNLPYSCFVAQQDLALR